MTDDSSDVDAVPDTDAVPEESAAVEEPTEQPDPAEESNPNTEAAKWRHKFRDEQTTHKETQTQLADMSARVEALQRQQVEALLDASKVKPAALWATTDLAQLVADDGTVDAGAVTKAIDAARKTLGIAPVGKGNHIPGVGNRPDGLPRKSDGFVDAFKPRRK